MHLLDAIELAERWTKDMRENPNHGHVLIFEAMQVLLVHTKEQAQDIESLTNACRTLLKENWRLKHDSGRSTTAG